MKREIPMTEYSNLENRWNLAEMELVNARLARGAGNEGKARVCARRAAGKALTAAGISSDPPLAAIRQFIQTLNLPDDIKNACSHMLLTVNEGFTLANNIDLISDAEKVLNYLRIRSTK
jgi:hypothetical protein